jgi:hypothetical protein
MIIRYFTEPVSVIRPGTRTDRYGNTVPDWDTANSVDVLAWVEPVAVGTENIEGRSALASEWLLLAAADTQITGRDRVVYQGQTFDVIGPPVVRKAGRRGPHHVEARLRWAEG